MLKTVFEKMFGLDQLRIQTDITKKELLDVQLEAEQARQAAEAAQSEKEQAEKEAELAKLSPKDRATEAGEPWVAVLETHVNKDNLRNGFFELDWNKYFIDELIRSGYGSEGDPEEEIVDRWFRLLCKDVASDEGIDMSSRGAGYINVTKLANGKSEVS